jgi:hypothetical protein
MRARRRFQPSRLADVALEERMVLSGGGAQGASDLLRGLHAPARVFTPHKPVSVSSLVDLAFQSFQQDYTAGRATYLAAVQDRTATSADTLAFQKFTTQRVNLLAQQVVNSLLIYGNTTSRGHRSPDAIPVVQQKLIATGDTKAVPRATGTLAGSLIASIPAADASTTTVALSTFTQDNAIAASRVAVQNSVTILRNGNFGSTNTNHKH